MKRVLILTAGFGDGHNAAARSLRDALDQVSDEVQVDVVDPLEQTYGAFNTLARKAYQGLVQYAPEVWNGLYALLDRPFLTNGSLHGADGLKRDLGRRLRDAAPDIVVSTYPLYGHVIRDLYPDPARRPFRFLTVVTDSLTLNGLWYRAPADCYCVPNDATAEVLRSKGVADDRIRAFGFPVSPQFAEPHPGPPAIARGGPRRLLYVINTGKPKAGKALKRLLADLSVELTVVVGRDRKLKQKLTEKLAGFGPRARVFGWTNLMPRLMMGSHVVIGKAGGALVQECIAAGTPLIVNQIIPGQEEGNARLVQEWQIGAVAGDDDAVVAALEAAFAHGGRLWGQWKANVARRCRPDAALRLAEFVLDQRDQPRNGSVNGNRLNPAPAPVMRLPATRATPRSALLLCDFHIHTNYSDGRLTAPEVIDFYGQRGFDCIAITDHVVDPRRLVGKFAKLTRLSLSPVQFDEYFDVLDRERRRAWHRYGMLVLAGLEFNKPGEGRKRSAHLLGLDLQGPIDPGLDLAETLAQIHLQGGLAVASYPHTLKSPWGKNTSHLWENQHAYAPWIDAWEIANRNLLVRPADGLGLPLIANSDFHRPRHIYSWKTLLRCEKDADAIKSCIRGKRHVTIALYGDLTRQALDSAELNPAPNRARGGIDAGRVSKPSLAEHEQLALAAGVAP